MRYLFIIFCLLLSSGSFAQKMAAVCDSPEVKAYFPFGQDSLFHFIKHSLHFEDAGDRITGKATVVFIVETDGTIHNAEILNTSKNKDFDNEAVRVVKTIAGWEPAKNKGNPVRSTDMLTVAYTVR